MKIKSATSIKGRREYMEDYASFLEHGAISIATVCDGHGGDSMSKKCSKELPVLLLNNLNISKDPVETALTIRNVILHFGESSKRTRSGSTVTGVIDNKNWEYIYIFNIGDSRTSIHMNNVSDVYHLKPEFGFNGQLHGSSVVLYKTQFFTTADHDSENTEEKKRIELSSGVLMGDRLNGILNVTRTLGDSGVGPGLSYIPDVYWVKRSDVISPIFMYTDGVYETFKGDKTIEKKHMLYHMAEKWGTETLVKHVFDQGSTDNITAVLVDI